MQIDKSLINSNMTEIKRLLTEICDELPAGSVPSLEVSESLFQVIKHRKDVVQLSVKLIVNREPETF